MRKFLFISLILLLYQCGSTQAYNFTGFWESLGPNEKPLEDRRQAATGIGPVEFIRASKTKEGLIIAGSINGGLFFSEDGGQQWINAGSDSWHYSSCGWAEIQPDNEDIWFALSSSGNENGMPGQLGHHGGILRTLDAGLNWEFIADKLTFTGSEYLAVHGFKFHPNDPNQLIVYTDDGLYRTEDCMASEVVWERIPGIREKIFDIAFTDSHIYISQKLADKWNVLIAPINRPEKFEKIGFIERMPDPMLGITFEKYKNEMLILINYIRKGDELYSYSASSKNEEKVLKNQRVIFGWGRTMAVSPHREEELILGFGTSIKRWKISEKVNLPRIRGGYHVDIEDIEYDPFDSMKVYIATHGGVYTSVDDCQSWVSTSQGLGIAEVEATAVSNIDPNVVVIGCYHDGSSMRVDSEGNGTYQWKNINGGDGLVPLLPKNDISTVYTSNQYTGGGIYVSLDTGRTKVNVHNQKRLNTAGWQMAANLHPENSRMLFFNYAIRNGEGKGNVDIARTLTAELKDTSERISNFLISHQLKKYSVYGIYNSPLYPNEMYIHLIEFTKDQEGKPFNVHHVYRTTDCTADAGEVIDSWYEVEIPRSDWIACITPSEENSDRLFLAYVAGIAGTELTENDFGLVYSLKYKKGSGDLISENDITQNIPYGLTGRYNLIPDGEGGLFFGTRLGLFYGDKSAINGWGEWIELGFGLPHNKIHGIYLNKKENSLTIGLYGRGVWKYYL
jgi:hypothetical protein